MEENVNHDKNETAKEFMEEIVDDLGYTPKGSKNPGNTSNTDPRPVPLHFLLGGVGIILLIAVVAFFLTGKNGDQTGELAAIKAGVDRIEKRIADLDRVEERLALIEGQKGIMGLEDRIIRLEREEKRLQQGFKQMADRPVIVAPEKSAPKAKQRYHTVRSGESLYSIAHKYGMSTDQLCKLNNITPKKPIHPGQKLVVGG